ncbi:hypothetical protein ASC94_10000 [Massilia sp. Root418]|uniref:DUF2303 family protein n=1 Tax=Massilia sp. Root418 TaxID=1736532 RepID=UPI000701C7F2|nr:DUF2303 family protein [Massilia sp. Root418]KQW97116.1 hypothetical protein ASC94_10000 [Massilia sp. Root418]
MMSTTPANDDLISTIRDLANAGAEVKEIEGTFHLVAPAGYQHIDLTKVIHAVAETPQRKAGTSHLDSMESLSKYLLDQASNTRCYIYADTASRTLTAVLNDHYSDDETPGWRDHRAVYKAELTREFANWLSHSGKAMEQEEFATFLEDNIADIAEPSGETLMAVALTLQAKSEVSFKSHRRLDNGQVQLGYSENVSTTAGADGTLEIPREFAIGLRLFKNGVGYKIRARLKYRLTASKVKFWYELDRAENAIEEAFAGYVASAQATGFTVLMGRP